MKLGGTRLEGGTDFGKVLVQMPHYMQSPEECDWFFGVLCTLAGLVFRGLDEMHSSGLAFVTQTMTARGRVSSGDDPGGPGACEVFFGDGGHFPRKEPFIVAFVTVGKTAEERAEEFRHFTLAVNMCVNMGTLGAPIAVEIDLTRHHENLLDRGLVEEVWEMRKRFEGLGFPVGAKLPVIDLGTAFEIARHFDFLTVTDVSSDAPTPMSTVADFVAELRRSDLSIPIIVGGVQSASDVLAMIAAGADGVRIDTVSPRLWEIAGIVRAAQGFPDKR